MNAETPGNGSVCVTRFEAGEEPCCSCKEVTVNEVIDPCIPATSISIRQIEIPGNGCPGDVIGFVADIQPDDATIDPGSFFWEAGTDIIISDPFFQQTTTNPIVGIPTPNGENSIWVRVTFTSCDGSTVDAFTLLLWENNCFKKISPVAFGGSGSIAPNPFTDQTQLHFTAEESMNAQIGIYNVEGRLIYSKAVDLSKGENAILLNELPAEERGVLYYRMVAEKEVLANGKLLRED